MYFFEKLFIIVELHKTIMKRIYLTLCVVLSMYTLKAQDGVPVEQVKEGRPVFYEIFVRSFADGNGDGIGDLQGITFKLDYLKELGIGGLWLTPIHPSPSYHKYDVMDYKAIDPEYGTIDDFRVLVNEAHRRGIKVLLDLVLNHTSSRHQWFVDASYGRPPYELYYSWSEKATEKNWYQNIKNPQRKYYAHFGDQMPDLNFSFPGLRHEIFEIVNFWFELGVDGFRLGDVEYIFGVDKTQDNITWWQDFKGYVKQKKNNATLIGEVNNKDSVILQYLRGSVDACFNFNLSRSIIENVNKGEVANIAKTFYKTQQLYSASNPEYNDATFISNHSQDRIASVFNGNEKKMKQAISILLTLPGTPFLYYGEEIGMLGKSSDELRREPFLWYDDRNRNTHWEEAHYSLPSVVTPLDMQQQQENSIFNYYKKLIKLRNENPVLSLGTITLDKDNTDKALMAYTIEYKGTFYRVWHYSGKAAKKITLPAKGNVIFSENATVSGKSVSLNEYSTLVMKM